MSFPSLLFGWLLSSCFTHGLWQRVGTSGAGAAASALGWWGHSSSRRCFSSLGSSLTSSLLASFIALWVLLLWGEIRSPSTVCKREEKSLPRPSRCLLPTKTGSVMAGAVLLQGHGHAPRACSQLAAVSHWLLCRIS